MSGTQPNTNLLTDAQLTDARRFMGYEAYGNPGSAEVGFSSWKYFAIYGTVEFRLANLSATELVVVTNYLSQLNTLEANILTTVMDTEKASVWTHNKAEMADRQALYNYWRLQLCSFLGIPPGEGLRNSGGSIAFIV